MRQENGIVGLNFTRGKVFFQLFSYFKLTVQNLRDKEWYWDAWKRNMAREFGSQPRGQYRLRLVDWVGTTMKILKGRDRSKSRFTIRAGQPPPMPQNNNNDDVYMMIMMMINTY